MSNEGVIKQSCERKGILKGGLSHESAEEGPVFLTLIHSTCFGSSKELLNSRYQTFPWPYEDMPAALVLVPGKTSNRICLHKPKANQSSIWVAAALSPCVLPQEDRESQKKQRPKHHSL